MLKCHLYLVKLWYFQTESVVFYPAGIALHNAPYGLYSSFNSKIEDVVVYSRLIPVNIIHRYCYCIFEIQI